LQADFKKRIDSKGLIHYIFHFDVESRAASRYQSMPKKSTYRRLFTATISALLLLSPNLDAQQKPLPNLKYAYSMAKSHDYKAAISTITAFPDNAFKPEIVLMLADYYYYADSKTPGDDFFTNKLATQSNVAVYYLGLARLAELAAEWKQAFEFCIKGFEAGAIFPELLEIMVESGLQLNQSSQLAKSLRTLQKSPEQKSLHELGYAIWRLRINNLSRARDTIRQYLSTDPLESYGLMVAGDIHKSLGELDTSTDYYKNALTNLPVDSKRRRILLLGDISLNAVSAEQITEARDYLRGALAIADEIGAIQHWLVTAEAAIDWLKETRLPTLTNRPSF